MNTASVRFLPKWIFPGRSDSSRSFEILKKILQNFEGILYEAPWGFSKFSQKRLQIFSLNFLYE